MYSSFVIINILPCSAIMFVLCSITPRMGQSDIFVLLDLISLAVLSFNKMDIWRIFLSNID